MIGLQHAGRTRENENEEIRGDRPGGGSWYFYRRKFLRLEDPREERMLEFLEKPGMEEKTRLLRILKRGRRHCPATDAGT